MCMPCKSSAASYTKAAHIQSFACRLIVFDFDQTLSVVHVAGLAASWGGNGTIERLGIGSRSTRKYDRGEMLA